MPELPEVQTVVNDLTKQGVIGAKILRTVLFWPASIAEPLPGIFCEQIAGQTITQIERQGKYICFTVGLFTLLIHLRMSGKLFIETNGSNSTHDRVHLHLDDGRVIKFNDQRKFGRLYLLKDPSQRFLLLGVDPLLATFTISHLKQVLQTKKKMKSLLLDQTAIAGIGNIYADEALWEAKIHPETPAEMLSAQEIERLHRAIPQILRLAIANRGTSLTAHRGSFHSATGERGKHATQLKVYHKTGTPCLRCQTTILRIKIQGRSSHFCPQCQVKK